MHLKKVTGKLERSVIRHLGIVGLSFLTSFSSAASEALPPELFAVVNDREISAVTFDTQARQAFRDNFYHGQPPEDAVNRMLKNVGDRLIDEILIAEEIKKRGLAAPPEEVSAQIAALEERYRADPEWAAARESVLPRLKARIEQALVKQQLERDVRTINPTEQELRAFYLDRPDTFTAPEQIKISLILLKVPPFGNNEDWKKARTFAAELRQQIADGEDFAELAKKHSKDHTADIGGQMEYQHRGMINETVQTAVDDLEPGEITEPIQVLEGIALVRLDGRISAKLLPFESVKERAQSIYIREMSDKAWISFLDGLRKGAQIQIGPAFTSIMETPAAELGVSVGDKTQ